MPYSPFNYGNALAQAEGIRGQQLKNRLLQNQLSAPPGSNIDPTSNMRDIQFLRKMKDEGYSDDQIEIFKQAIVKRDAFLSDPMLNREGLAGNYIAGQKAAGGARGELAGNQGLDFPMFSPQAVPSTQLNTEGVNLGGQPRIQTKAEQEAQIAADKEKAVIKARLGDDGSPGVADVARAQTTAQEEAKAGVKEKVTAKQNERAYSTYRVARDNLESALKQTTTGWVAGKIPAATASAQIAQSAQKIIFPAVKSLVREAGEGIFTDRDAEDVQAMLPTRETHPDALPTVFWQIDSYIASKLGQEPPPPPAGAIERPAWIDANDPRWNQLSNEQKQAIIQAGSQ